LQWLEKSLELNQGGTLRQVGTLVTGFGPFGEIGENPSAWLAEHSEREHVVLDVSYAAVETWLESGPEFDRLLMVGVSGRANGLNLELIGRNVTGKALDIDHVGGPAMIDGRDVPQLGSTLYHGLTELPNGIEFSHSAGDYLCNFSLFRALQSFPDRKVGFLHVPLFGVMERERQLGLLKWLLDAVEA
jgi:pyrrolidone-carboxylate peptidase